MPVVCAPSHAAVIMASHMVWCSAIGGARWSINATPPNPESTATLVRSVIVGKPIRI